MTMFLIPMFSTPMFSTPMPSLQAIPISQRGSSLHSATTSLSISVLTLAILLLLGNLGSMIPTQLAFSQQSVVALSQDPPSEEKSSTADTMKNYSVPFPAGGGNIKMIALPAGTGSFPAHVILGSPEAEMGRKADEGPEVKVTIEPFWMSECEITWDLYNQFRAEYSKSLDRRLNRDTATADQWADAVSIPTPLWEQDSAPILEGLGQQGGYPVADVSQYAAMQFSKWLSKKTGRFFRLPTEAEWEYAARAGTRTAYFFGDDASQLGEYAWSFDNSAYDDFERGYPGESAGYRKVRQKKPNPWGLYDIYGNVSEWVLDQYHPKHYSTLQAGSSWQQAISWPKTIFPCVTRGGNWRSDPEECRSASRFPSAKSWQQRDPQIPKSLWWYTDAFHIGFRVICPLKTPDPVQQRRYWDSTAPGVLDVLKTGDKQLRTPISSTQGKKS